MLPGLSCSSSFQVACEAPHQELDPIDRSRGSDIVARYSGGNADPRATPDAMFRLGALYEEKARARKVAAMASRTNFVLSIPMLLCMASATHGLPF